MRVFLDTNIFLYSFLDQDVGKKAIAARLVADAVQRQCGFISLQVVKEFCNVMVKKSGRSATDIARALDVFRSVNVVGGSLETIRRAMEIREEHGIQFYDALMLSSAETATCSIIFTEDLNDGQIYGSVKALNPFKGI